jgi:phosphoribosylamine-glycine ligase
VLQWRQSAYAVGVVMASKGYPESSSKGDVITGKGMRQREFRCNKAIMNNACRGHLEELLEVRLVTVPCSETSLPCYM